MRSIDSDYTTSATTMPDFGIQRGVPETLTAPSGKTFNTEDLYIDFDAITEAMSEADQIWAEDMLMYLQARKEVENTMNGLSESLMGVLGETESAFEKLSGYSPEVAKLFDSLGKDSIEVAKAVKGYLDNATPEEFVVLSAELGVTYDDLISYSQEYIEILHQQNEAIKNVSDSMAHYLSGDSDFAAEIKAIEENLNGLDLQRLAVTGFEDAASIIATMNSGELLEAATSVGWAEDVFAENMEGVSSSLIKVNEQFNGLNDNLERRIHNNTKEHQTLVDFDKKYKQIGGFARIASMGPLEAAKHLQEVIGDYDTLAHLSEITGIEVTDIAGDYEGLLGVIDTLFDAEKDRYETMMKYAKDFNDYVHSLKLGDLSVLNPTEQLDLAGSAYEDLLAKAKGGDIEAMEKLQGAAQTFLEKSRSYYASGDEYVDTFNKVTGDLEGLSLDIEEGNITETDYTDNFRDVVSEIYGLDLDLLDIGDKLYEALTTNVTDKDAISKYGELESIKELVDTMVNSVVNNEGASFEGVQRILLEAFEFGIDWDMLAASVGMNVDSLDAILADYGLSTNFDPKEILSAVKDDSVNLMEILENYFAATGGKSYDTVMAVAKHLIDAGYSLEEIIAATSTDYVEGLGNTIGVSLEEILAEKYLLAENIGAQYGLDRKTIVDAVNDLDLGYTDIAKAYFDMEGVSNASMESFMESLQEAGVSLNELAIATGFSEDELESLVNTFGQSFDTNQQALYDMYQNMSPVMNMTEQETIDAVNSGSGLQDLTSDYFSEQGVTQDTMQAYVDYAKGSGVSAEQIGEAYGISGTEIAQITAAQGVDFSFLPDQGIIDRISGIISQYPESPEDIVNAVHQFATFNGITSDRLSSLIDLPKEEIISLAEMYGLPAFAKGGIIDTPTIGLVGEAGPEAIVPLNQMGSARVLQDIADRYNVPQLANGGFVTDPTFALIGEAGPEAVVPLDKADKFISPNERDGEGDDEELKSILRAILQENRSDREQSERIEAILKEMYKGDREDGRSITNSNEAIGDAIEKSAKRQARVQQNQNDINNGN